MMLVVAGILKSKFKHTFALIAFLCFRQLQQRSTKGCSRTPSHSGPSHCYGAEIDYRAFSPNLNLFFYGLLKSMSPIVKEPDACKI